MADFPGWRNVYPDPQDDIMVEICEKHGEYEYERDSRCPYCARYQAKRRAAILGLEVQVRRLTKHNAVDKGDLVTDLKRALSFLRDQT